MLPRYLFLIICLAFLVNAIPPVSLAQDDGIQLDLVTSNQINETELQLRVSVSATNGTIPSLNSQNFLGKIENLDPFPAESITRVSNAELPPRNVVVLVDISDSIPLEEVIKPQLPSLFSSIQQIPNSRIAIMPFSNRVLNDPSSAGITWYPLTNDFEGTSNFIGGLRVERIGVDTNVLVNAISAGINYSIENQIPGQESYIVVITDAIETPDMTGLAAIAQNAQNANIRISSIVLPNLKATVGAATINPAIPQFFAENTDGKLFIHNGELTVASVSTSFASSIITIIDDLTIQYDVVFDFGDQLKGKGLSGKLDFETVLEIDDQNVSNSVETEIDYLETIYSVSFTGLTDGMQLTGEIPLTLAITPALPPNQSFRYYFFSNDEIPISNCSEASPTCIWNTTTAGIAPGLYQVQGVVFDGVNVVARGRVSLNIYSNNLIVDVPPTVSGQVILEITTIGYEELGEVVELYGEINGQDTLLVSQVLSNEGNTPLQWDIEKTVFAADTSSNALSMPLRVEIRNRTRNLTLARWEAPTAIQVVRLPDYHLTLAGLPLSSDGSALLLRGTYNLTLQVDQPLLADMVLAIFLINPENPEPQILASNTESTLSFTLNTANYLPSYYQIGAAILRDGAVLDSTSSIFQNVNIYRPLESVTFSNRTGQVITGNSIVQINTAGYSKAGVVILFVNDKEVTRSLVDRDGNVSLNWNIDALYFSETKVERTANIRLDLMNADATYILGRMEETITLRASITFILRLGGLNEGEEITEERTLTAVLDPIPPVTETYLYIFSVAPLGSNDFQVLPQESATTPTVTLKPQDFTPGDYQLQVNVNRGTDQIALKMIQYRSIRPLILGDSLRSDDLDATELKGKDSLEINNLSDVVRIRIDFRATDSDSYVPVLVEPLKTDKVTTEVDVNWQSKFFSDNDNDQIAGTVRIRLTDGNDRPLYEWHAERTLLNDHSTPLWKAVLYGVLALVAFLTTVRLYKRVRRKSLGKETRIMDSNAGLLILYDAKANRVEWSAVLDEKPIYIGRIESKVLPWDKMPQINIQNDLSVSRRMGRIILDKGNYVFVGEKNSVHNVFYISPRNNTAYRLTETDGFNVKKRSIMLNQGKIVIGSKQRWQIYISDGDDDQNLTTIQ